ncbi:MAG: methionyl-tRNA formyltransferase [Clostridia bacterium]|nr:methionyl-tRNA formyltransferase [Clostridia bacterium]
MRIAFLGTPVFALPSLEALIRRGDTLAVFTQPDRPVGRKAILTPPPVKVLAESHGIPVYQFEKIRSSEGREALEAFAPDLMVTAAFGQLLSSKNLAIPRLGTINVHGSLLPKYRGASPIQSAIIAGESETGVTTMMTEIGMDTGDMLLKTVTPIDPDETYGELSDRLAVLGAELLNKTLDMLEAGMLVRVPQDPEQATVCHMLTKEDGHIDCMRTAKAVHDLVRGTNPWPCAFVLLDGQPLKIFETKRTDETFSVAPGTLCERNGKLYLVCGDSALEIVALQASGKKRMDAGTFLRGCPLDGKTVC